MPIDFARPRSWQVEARDALLPKLLDREGARRHLIFVVTGGGKTFFGAWLAQLTLEQRLYRRVVILVPARTTIEKQWREAVCGLDAVEVVTFLKAAKANVADEFTLVIIDEFHHLGEDQRWGLNAERFVEAASDCVLLSGTPKRSDGVSIPLLRGSEAPVYEYRYGAAVRDGFCRYMEAHDDYDGLMSWTEGENRITESFGLQEQGIFKPNPLDKRGDSRRYNTGIQTEFALVQRMLVDAVAKLKEIRTIRPRAQGIVIVTSEIDADEVAGFMRSECDVDPLVIKSSSGRSDADVAAFKANVGNHKSWIISITKISEGSDIPNLCVLVYKSRIRAELFMTQVAGRVMRNSTDTSDVKAHVYFPRDGKVRAVFCGLQNEADAAVAGAESHAPMPQTPEGEEDDDDSDSDDASDVAAEEREPDSGWMADVDDGSSDGSIDADALPWESVAADLEDANDENSDFLTSLHFAVRDSGNDITVVRARLRKAFGLPPVNSVDIVTTPEHQRRRALERFNREVYAYTRHFRRHLGARGRKVGPLLAKEKSRLVLRLLKRKGLKSDGRRKPSELDAFELRDLMMTSLPSRVTKLRRLHTSERASEK